MHRTIQQVNQEKQEKQHKLDTGNTMCFPHKDCNIPSICVTVYVGEKLSCSPQYVWSLFSKAALLCFPSLQNKF